MLHMSSFTSCLEKEPWKDFGPYQILPRDSYFGLSCKESEVALGDLSLSDGASSFCFYAQGKIKEKNKPEENEPQKGLIQSAY